MLLIIYQNLVWTIQWYEPQTCLSLVKNDLQTKFRLQRFLHERQTRSEVNFNSIQNQIIISPKGIVLTYLLSLFVNFPLKLFERGFAFERQKKFKLTHFGHFYSSLRREDDEWNEKNCENYWFEAAHKAPIHTRTKLETNTHFFAVFTTTNINGPAVGMNGMNRRWSG